jgi:hypothetical protein
MIAIIVDENQNPKKYIPMIAIIVDENQNPKNFKYSILGT